MADALSLSVVMRDALSAVRRPGGSQGITLDLSCDRMKNPVGCREGSTPRTVGRRSWIV